MSKINLFYRFLIAATTVCSFTACDFLDIVPDENATEKDTYSDKDKAEKYLYSCYGFLPQCNIAQNSLDLLTGDEVVSSFEHETFASFPKGNFTASNPVMPCAQTTKRRLNFSLVTIIICWHAAMVRLS